MSYDLTYDLTFQYDHVSLTFVAVSADLNKSVICVSVSADLKSVICVQHCVGH